MKESETSSAGRIGALQTLTKGCRPDKKDESSQLSGKQLPSFTEWPFVKGFIPDCVSLRGLNARDAHLPRIELRYADLNSARLQDAGLWHAKLAGVDLALAQLVRTKMSEVELSGASLKKANMQGVQLPDADLTKAKLVEADLSCSAGKKDENKKEMCANLTGADLTGADLTGANLTGADLTGSQLSDFKNQSAEAAISRTILYKTILSNVTLLPTQLLGKNEPLLCQTQLPEEMKAIDPDRDCNLIQQALEARYSSEELKKRPEIYQAPPILQKQ